MIQLKSVVTSLAEEKKGRPLLFLALDGNVLLQSKPGYGPSDPLADFRQGVLEHP